MNEPTFSERIIHKLGINESETAPLRSYLRVHNVLVDASINNDRELVHLNYALFNWRHSECTVTASAVLVFEALDIDLVSELWQVVKYLLYGQHIIID